jgi:molybdopterin converting factor small subunit
MKVEVLFFAQIRDALGSEREILDVREGGKVSDVIAVLRDRPAWRVIDMLPLSYAVNEEVVSEACPLHDGDRVVLLTPVSGG